MTTHSLQKTPGVPVLLQEDERGEHCCVEPRLPIQHVLTVRHAVDSPSKLVEERCVRVVFVETGIF